MFLKRFAIGIFTISACSFFFVRSPVFAESAPENNASLPCPFIFTTAKSSSVQSERIGDDMISFFFPPAEHVSFLSPLCSFEISSKLPYDGKRTVHISGAYSPTAFRPRIALWNADESRWEAKETVFDRSKHTVSADISAPNGVVAALADQRTSYEGVASWYAHKRYPFGAATNLFPVGTKVRVTNSDTGKNVVVTITSTWTQKNPKRIIDMVSTAFAKIAKKSAGIVHVRIEKI